MDRWLHLLHLLLPAPAWPSPTCRCLSQPHCVPAVAACSRLAMSQLSLPACASLAMCQRCQVGLLAAVTALLGLETAMACRTHSAPCTGPMQAFYGRATVSRARARARLVACSAVSCLSLCQPRL
eukprot:364334-Chlamydomonas_euryale.AAC.6